MKTYIALFRGIKFYGYFPSQRNGNVIGKEGALTYRMGNTRIYERGRKKKVNGSWPLESTDRVRIERIIGRTQLRKMGVREVGDWRKIDFPVSQKGLRFVKFRRTGRLPEEIDGYPHADKEGTEGSIQSEIKYYRKKIKNIAQTDQTD